MIKYTDRLLHFLFRILYSLFKKILNKEQGIMNDKVYGPSSAFLVQNSLFTIQKNIEQETRNNE
jgi:hypothetical protein